jgi:hypothetical protein
VAFVGDDEPGLVAAKRLAVGSRVHNRHEDVDVVQGVRAAVAERAAPTLRQVALEGYQPLALEFSSRHQDQDLDALPDRLECRSDANAGLAGAGDGLDDTAARICVPCL